MGLGIVVGFLLGPSVGIVGAQTSTLLGDWLALPGRLFLVSIQFVVVPLVVASVIRGIAGGQAEAGFGRRSWLTLLFFMGTTLFAAIVGLLLAGVIGPGRLIDSTVVSEVLAGADTTAAATTVDLPQLADIPSLILSLFPDDPLSSFVSGNMLQIVIAAVILGVALVQLPQGPVAVVARPAGIDPGRLHGDRPFRPAVRADRRVRTDGEYRGAYRPGGTDGDGGLSPDGHPWPRRSSLPSML